MVIDLLVILLAMAPMHSMLVLRRLICKHSNWPSTGIRDAMHCGFAVVRAVAKGPKNLPVQHHAASTCHLAAQWRFISIHQCASGGKAAEAFMVHLSHRHGD